MDNTNSAPKKTFPLPLNRPASSNTPIVPPNRPTPISPSSSIGTRTPTDNLPSSADSFSHSDKPNRSNYNPDNDYLDPKNQDTAITDPIVGDISPKYDDYGDDSDTTSLAPEPPTFDQYSPKPASLPQDTPDDSYSYMNKKVDTSEDPFAFEPEPQPLEDIPKPITADAATAQAPVVPPTPIPPVLKPATTPPSSNNSSAFFIFVLSIIALSGIAGSILFYRQAQQLQEQIKEITNTLNNQQLNPTATPTTSPVPSSSITPTTSSTPRISPTATLTPSAPTVSPASFRTFEDIDQVLKEALKHSPTAQLLLISAENPSGNHITKYFFRVSPDTKKYFYIAKSSSSLTLIDKQIYVSPDNNIPSLNQIVTDKNTKDLDEIISITSKLCPDTSSCTESFIKAKLVKTTAPVWEVTYLISDKTKIVFQVEALTGKIAFQSI